MCLFVDVLGKFRKYRAGVDPSFKNLRFHTSLREVNSFSELSNLRMSNENRNNKVS